MANYTAAAMLYRLVRQYAQTAPDWTQPILYDTRPDERWDLTLVAQRVYADRREWLAVMAAAGMDSLEQEMSPRRLRLPPKAELTRLKDRAGFVTDEYARDPAAAAAPLTSR